MKAVQEMTLAELQETFHGLAKTKGWHDEQLTKDGVAAKLMLVVSELSEALEELRSGDAGRMNMYFSDSDKPEGFVVELADAVIRIMDLAGALSLDLSHAVTIKHIYNTTRPYRHGNKSL